MNYPYVVYWQNSHLYHKWKCFRTIEKAKSFQKSLKNNIYSIESYLAIDFQFKSKKELESALAMSELSGLIKIYNNGWVPDWDNYDVKCCIVRRYNKIEKRNVLNDFHFLAFTGEITRDMFLKNYEHLIRKYFMLD
jgi:hypothetical protein